MPLNDLSNLNNQPSTNGLPNANGLPNSNSQPNDLQSFPPAKVNEADRKKLKRIYISLILIGLAIGVVMSVVIVMALNYFGLTARPEG